MYIYIYTQKWTITYGWTISSRVKLRDRPHSLIELYRSSWSRSRIQPSLWPGNGKIPTTAPHSHFCFRIMDLGSTTAKGSYWRFKRYSIHLSSKQTHFSLDFKDEATDAFNIRHDCWLENDFSSSHMRAHIQRACLQKYLGWGENHQKTSYCGHKTSQRGAVGNIWLKRKRRRKKRETKTTSFDTPTLWRFHLQRKVNEGY